MGSSLLFGSGTGGGTDNKKTDKRVDVHRRSLSTMYVTVNYLNPPRKEATNPISSSSKELVTAKSSTYVIKNSKLEVLVDQQKTRVVVSPIDDRAVRGGRLSES